MADPENSGNVLITGATGLVGRTVLEQIPHALATTRHAASAAERLRLPRERLIEWDPMGKPISPPPGLTLRGLVNLMGEPVAEGRWNKEKKDRIRNSRVVGTQNLVRGLLEHGVVPDVLVSASAVGYYGDRDDEVLTEASPPGEDFLSDVCRQWEEAATQLAAHGSRVVCLRIGMVLSRDGGALPRMTRVFRWGIGGPFGWGRQWYPWIHIDDLVDLILWALDKSDVSGPVNATAPQPVRNREFVSELGRHLHRPTVLPVPRLAARMALGEFADVLFHSQRAIPQAALDAGFQFRFNTIATALDDLLS